VLRRNSAVSRLSNATTSAEIGVEMFGLQGPEAYAYTSRSGGMDVGSIDDVKDFQETLVSNPTVLNT
jgi:myosin heavy subunit